MFVIVYVVEVVGGEGCLCNGFAICELFFGHDCGSGEVVEVGEFGFLVAAVYDSVGGVVGGDDVVAWLGGVAPVERDEALAGSVGAQALAFETEAGTGLAWGLAAVADDEGAVGREIVILGFGAGVRVGPVRLLFAVGLFIPGAHVLCTVEIGQRSGVVTLEPIGSSTDHLLCNNVKRHLKIVVLIIGYY